MKLLANLLSVKVKFISASNAPGGCASIHLANAARVKYLAVIIILLAMMTGCGNVQESGMALGKVGEEKKEGSEEENSPKEGRHETDGEETEQGDFFYLEKVKLTDINAWNSKYEIYVPKGSDVDDSAYYTDHGISYSARVNGLGGVADPYSAFDEYYETLLESCQGPDDGFTDMTSSGILKNGNDKYFIFTGRGVQYDGTPYEIRQIFYMEMLSEENCIMWDLDMYQEYADEETDLIISELAQCYGIDLDIMKAASLQPEDDQDQDAYEVREGNKVLENLGGYQYMGLAALSDYYKEAVCSVMVPKSRFTTVRDMHASSFLHGVQIVADVEEFYYSYNLMGEMKPSLDVTYESRENEKETVKNLRKSNIMPVPGFEDALYAVIAYEKQGYRKGEYFTKAEVLCSFRFDDSHYLSVEIFLNGEEYDEATNTVIRELENAYGIDLSEFYNKGMKEESAEFTGKEEPVTLAELIGVESSGEEALPETILWFNATYAPLTYSNGWNWKLVGGTQLIEENIAMLRGSLQGSWSVYDRESALETVESLKEKGHRKTCQDCMDELDALGLLDLEESEFRKRFLQAGLTDNTYRYVIAYEMHQAGQDADFIAAWDLCRVNQLYAGFYVCGYMDYEEAMDASLENSLILQQMYDSWEEMMEGYLLGYQFWLGESGEDEDSPTQERYRIYEILKGLENGPYSLNWNMELKKSW